MDLSVKKNKFYMGLQEKTLPEKGSNWSIPCYWFPLKKIKEDIPVLAFDSDDFADGKRLKILKEIFTKHHVKSVTVIPEIGNDYIENDFLRLLEEQDEDGYVFPYASERFIYDETEQWMIYTSHELTISFAGEWLTEEICKCIFNADRITNTGGGCGSASARSN